MLAVKAVVRGDLVAWFKSEMILSVSVTADLSYNWVIIGFITRKRYYTLGLVSY